MAAVNHPAYEVVECSVACSVLVFPQSERDVIWDGILKLW